MSTERLINAVKYLRSNGGYFLTVTPIEGGFVIVGSFKDVGAYSSTVSYCATGADIDEVQEACTLGLANLVKFTEGAKPVKEAKQAATPAYQSAQPTGNGAIVSLKGLQDPHWGKAKDIVKAAGFRFEKDSKDWIGGDVNKLPDWLKKRVKGGNSYSDPKPAPTTKVEEMEQESMLDDGIGIDDDMPF